MYLKTIEIQGFKSFPDKTIISFHPGMTAIVGPNGSGKSNVTDAIRWVLGEQSAKTLRGQKMEDVIFSGTATRRPLSYAEVTIVFDNASGQLALPYQDVAVTRRLFRSGESEYLINRQSCRLKDVHQLFLDTGIGRDGYSIVGQGRVDDLLSPRSEDRRRIFEEAAGIAKLRVQKEESQRRLDQTQLNLERSQDVLDEIRLRLAPLKKQAEQAQLATQLQAQLKHRDCSKAWLQFEQLQKQQNSLTAKAADAQAEWDHIQAKAQETEATYQTLAQALETVETALETAKNKQQTLEMAQLQETQNLQNQAQQQGRMEAAWAQLEAEDQRAQADETTIKQAIETAREAVEQAQAAYLNHDQKTAADREALAQAQNELTAQQNQIEALYLRANEAQEAYLEAKTQAADQQALWKSLMAQDEALQEQTQQTAQEVDELSAHLEQLNDEASALSSQLADLSHHLEEAQNDLEEASHHHQAIIQQKADLERESEQLTYRFQTLQSLETHYEGYQTAVVGLLGPEGLPPNQRSGILGTVAECLNVPAEYEVAIEVALGGAVQNIVTDTPKTAAHCIDVLKKRQLGRATFLPLSVLKPREIPENLWRRARQSQGFIGRASDLVHTVAGQSLSGLAEHLLGGILIVETLEDAQTLAKVTEQRLRLVTLAGESLAPGGAMTGGSLKAKRTRFLGRTREMESLKNRLEQLPLTLNRIEVQEKKALEERQILAEQLTDLHEQQARSRQALLRLETRIEALQDRRTLLAKRMAGNQADQTARAAEKTRLAEALKTLEAQAQACQQAIQTHQQELEALQTARHQAERKRDQYREGVHQANLQAQGLKHQVEQAKQALSHWQTEQKNQVDRQAENEKRRADLQAEREQFNQAYEAAQQQLEKLRFELEQAHNHRQQLEANQQQATREREQALLALNDLTQRRVRVGQELERLHAAQQHAQTQEETVRRHLWEQYECVYEQLSPDQLDLKTSIHQLDQTITQLKQQLRSLGPIHYQAIEEYEAVNEREQFLTAQHEDIQTAQKQLLALIDELNQTMSERFATRFEQINQRFNAIFSDLFGGGQAQVILGPGETLEAPIEIKASPPGKRLQNMLLLSGGERALTAIALLFAILSLSPTPFVVLDEIEAALDDANVLRFTDYIRAHAQASQFILVTHRKGTMEAAERIYGVTMQERGVSRVLSMKLSEARQADLIE